MLIRKKTPRALRLDEPIRHEQTHKRPVTRRDFLNGVAIGAYGSRFRTFGAGIPQIGSRLIRIGLSETLGRPPDNSLSACIDINTCLSDPQCVLDFYHASLAITSDMRHPSKLQTMNPPNAHKASVHRCRFPGV